MFYWIFRPLMWLFYKVCYRVKVFGKENLIKKGKNIVVCNHLSKADVLAVGALYPNKTIFLSKIEWFDNKVLGWFLKQLGTIPLDRDKPSLSSIKDGLQVLKDNKRLAIFPEGRRNFETNDLQEIKQGTALFAVKGQAQITPVILYDRLKMFKKGYVIVGKPFDFSEFYGQRFTDEVSHKCTQILSDKMHELQQEIFKLVEEEKSKKRKK